MEDSPNNNLAVLDVVVESRASLIKSENTDAFTNGQSEYKTNNHPENVLKESDFYPIDQKV